MLGICLACMHYVQLSNVLHARYAQCNDWTECLHFDFDQEWPQLVSVCKGTDNDIHTFLKGYLESYV